jgi:hypothetical protein
MGNIAFNAAAFQISAAEGTSKVTGNVGDDSRHNSPNSKLWFLRRQ